MNDNAYSRRDVLLAGVMFAGAASLATLLPRNAHAAASGILKIAYPEPPDTLDPQSGVSLAAHQLTSMICETLTVLDSRGEVQPRLATRWTPVDNGKEWVFELRPDVRFHHGKPFTAEDVVASVKRAEDPKLALASKGGFGPLQDIVADGPLKVRFILKTAFAELPTVVASPLKALIIPSDRIADLAKTPSGTGPFRFVKFSPGEGAEVERNPDYWDKGLPSLAGVQLQSIKDSVAQQAALRGGQTDVITLVSPETMLVLSKTPGIKTYTSPFGTYHSLVMQANQPPFDNPKVREAFKYILDRKGLMSAALFGQGEVGNDVPLPHKSVFVGDLPSLGQNLEKARKLLDEAGVKNLTLDLYTTSDRPPAPKLALAFAEAAGKIGVKINVIDIPYAEYAANVMRKRPLYTASMPVSPTVFDAIYRIYHSKGAMNYGTAEQTPGLDAVLDRMIGATDPAERTKLSQEALGMLHGPSERIIPYFINAVAASSSAVQNLELPVAYSVFDLTRVRLA